VAFASTVIPGVNLLEIHDQNLYYVLGIYEIRNGASSSTREGSVFLCRRYVSHDIPTADDILAAEQKFVYPNGPTPFKIAMMNASYLKLLEISSVQIKC
jgi:hypothetical protein